MARSLTPLPTPATPFFSTKSNSIARFSPLQFQSARASHNNSYNEALRDTPIHRRTLSLGFTAGLVGLNFGDSTANAGKRPPPPPPQEKKDPSLSGVQAKVLASKKRKEAMKSSVAKLREQGKPVNEAAD